MEDATINTYTKTRLPKKLDMNDCYPYTTFEENFEELELLKKKNQEKELRTQHEKK